jgi:predicted O-linked N-acetylglucosamine transferase (SPINDLY family)
VLLFVLIGRSQFEVFAFSTCARSQHDAFTARIAAGIEGRGSSDAGKFIDISHLSDFEASGVWLVSLLFKLAVVRASCNRLLR